MAKLEEVSIILEWREAPYADEQVLRSGFLGEKFKTHGPMEGFQIVTIDHGTEAERYVPCKSGYDLLPWKSG